MKCDFYRRPEMTITSCRSDRGSVIGRAERGMVKWGASVRLFDRYGQELEKKSDSFYDRNRAEAWLQGTVRGLSARAFGGVRRHRRRAGR